jgi:hybrid cluster-associated redox disulfide protein
MSYISANTTIEEIVREYPELIRPLMQFGIKCVMCGEPIWGTLEENAQEKGIENLNELVKELNKIIEKTHQEVKQ